MSNPQPPNEAIRDLMFRKAEALNQQLLKRLGDAARHLSKNNELGAIGALTGLESDVTSMRKLMALVRDHFPEPERQGGVNDR